MSRLACRLSVVLALTSAALVATGCHAAKTPELRVLGMNDAPQRQEVVFVQVTNPASHPLRLTKLEYSFAASGATLSTGEVPLAREIPAGAAVVVEVPFANTHALPATSSMTLRGRLTAELDRMVRVFRVSAQIRPH